MKKISYNKLVRDKIPEIIEASGKKYTVESMDKKEHLNYLIKKLQEELNEYYENNEIEELADLVEVIYGILSLEGISIKDFHSMREKKNSERGKFKKGLKLLEVIED